MRLAALVRIARLFARVVKGATRPILCRNRSVLWRRNIGVTEYQMHAYRKKTRVGRYLNSLLRVDIGLCVACTAALAAGFALTAAGTNAIESGSAEPEAEPAGVGADATGAPCATFAERFYFNGQTDSFDERFASAFASSGNAAGEGTKAGEHADNTLLQEKDFREDATGRPVVTLPLPNPVTTSRHASIREERVNTAAASVNVSLPLDPDSHTAIYDIAARTVYLPNGHRLEAHSGLGSHLDDPRYVSTKGQGPTPPNVYSLALRERLFHGVRALRLLPAENGKMFGRDGILAHSYMLGPSGQSNGCVSFRNYPAFLEAYLRGEVNRLVVVERLATTTGAKANTSSGG